MNTLAAILAAPVRIVVWLFHHPKALVVIIVLAVGLTMLRNCAAQPTAGVPSYQVVAPSIQQAPYLVQTSSRVYYVVKYTEANGALTLTEYYEYNKKEWEKQTFPLPLSKEYYGEVRIDVRKG